MSEAIASTSAGQLRGVSEEGGINFKGVPYAAPPVGDLRFRPPQPVTPWEGVRDAVALGPSCPQPDTRPPGWPAEHAEDEDCLYLNVWTPALDDGARPVMFWIHGGGYAIGSGSWPLYDGANLSRRGDAVVITVNHRLGPLGYLHLAELGGDEFASSGNNGMLDLVLALEWVKANAAAFGGDPGNVTVFGESGGGAKISTLLAMPQAAGLFHRAVIQSGPGVRVVSERRANEAARSLLEELEVTADNLSALWDLPAERFVESSAGGMTRMAFAPVLDGTVIPAHPVNALAEGTAIDVPMMIGCNRDEGAGSLPSALDEAGLRKRLAAYGEDRVDEITATYRDMIPGIDDLDLLSFVLTDSRMRYGSIQMAEAQVKGMTSPVFMYFFTYTLGGRAGHGYEIAFHFDNIGSSLGHHSPDRGRLVEEMSEAWLAFARSGDPNHKALAEWPPYQPPERSTMVFARGGSHTEDDPSAPARELWGRIFARPSRA